jgi:hypothetical protein
MTSYKTILDAQETLTRITSIPKNREAINIFQRSKTRTPKALFGKLYTGIQRKYYTNSMSYAVAIGGDFLSTPGKHGYGHGYNCKKTIPDTINVCRKGGWLTRAICAGRNANKLFSGYSPTYSNATAIVKYNIHKNRWFYLTSYPQ